MATTVKLNPSEIIVPDGRRSIDTVKVSELKESIEIIGLMNSITVRRVGDNFILVCGAHRREALILLGYTEVGCVVLEYDDDEDRSDPKNRKHRRSGIAAADRNAAIRTGAKQATVHHRKRHNRHHRPAARRRHPRLHRRSQRTIQQRRHPGK